MEIRTLMITAVASAIAAYACSKLWTPGTLVAAAFTPVILAIVKDAVTRSTDVVARAAPVRGIVRSAPSQATAAAGTPTGDAAARADPPPAQTVVQSPPGEPPLPPLPPAYGQLPADVEDDPAARVPQTGVIADDGGRRRRRGLRVAIVTGLLGFLLAAVAMTVPELVAGGSASGNGRGTTFFGGGSEREPAAEKPTAQPSGEGNQPAPQTTTVTVPAPEEDTTTVPEPDAIPPTGGDAAPLPQDPDADVQRSPDVVVAPAE